ncbi:unnamed protein product [Lepeophtheirus salmonis]|uniref:(salmon louse) hypothetical protein n=1 Tax=Lepeophtheirus salmonis TaxID=72036 RepID=A0A817F9C6_LEPSM|nr:unnamed protein product [Lepeophtheirus salmonis]CAG9475347.1 unnamed protein product [Lepeophtheirus salmonis]
MGYIYLDFKETLTGLKDYNLNRHYNTLHRLKFEKDTGAARAVTVAELHSKVCQGQDIFTKVTTFQELAITACYHVALELTKVTKQLLDGEVVKTCAVKMAKAFDDNNMVKYFEAMSLSRRIVTHGIFGIHDHVEQFKPYRNLIMILRRELKEAFCRSLLHPSSEHYIHGEFTHFLETRRLWPCVVLDSLILELFGKSVVVGKRGVEIVMDFLVDCIYEDGGRVFEGRDVCGAKRSSLGLLLWTSSLERLLCRSGIPDQDLRHNIYDEWCNLPPDTKSIWIKAAQKMLDFSQVKKLFFLDQGSVKRKENDKFMLVIREKLNCEEDEYCISKYQEIISKNLKIQLSHMAPDPRDNNASCFHSICDHNEIISTQEANDLVELGVEFHKNVKDYTPLHKKQLYEYMNDQGTQTLTVIQDVKSTQVDKFHYAQCDHLNLCSCQRSENCIKYYDDNILTESYNMVKEQLNTKPRNSVDYKKLNMFEPYSHVEMESVYFASVHAKKKPFGKDSQMNNVYSLEAKKGRTYNCYEKVSKDLYLEKVDNTSGFCFESPILKNNTIELGKNRCTTTLLNAVEDGLLGDEVQSEFMSYNILGHSNKNLFSSYEEYYSCQKSLPPISKSKSGISDKKLPPGLSILPFKILPSYEVDKSEKYLTGPIQNNPHFPNGLKAFIPNGYSLIKTSTNNGKLHYCFRKKKECRHLSSKEEKKKDKEIEKSSIVQLECEQTSIDNLIPVTLSGENQQLISQFDQSNSLSIDHNTISNSRTMVSSEQFCGSFKALLVLPGGQMVLTNLSNEQFDRMDISVVPSNGTCYEEISSENTIVHISPPESYPLTCVSGLIQKPDDVEIQCYPQLSPGGLYHTIPSTVSRSQDLSSTNNVSVAKVKNLNAPDLSISEPSQILKTEKQTKDYHIAKCS